jgi:superfamily II DNA or RNA helicase
MQIYINNNRTIQLAQVFEAFEEVIYKYFSVKDPQAQYVKSMGRGMNWDGVVRKYNRSQQRLSKAFLGELIDLCKKHDIPFEINDVRPKEKYPRPSFDSFDEKLIDGITLRPHQMRALRSVCPGGKLECKSHEYGDLISETGIHWHSTGAGKTEIAAGITKLFRCPTVIITEQTVVLEQIAERLKLRSVVHNDDIGLFCSGKTPENNVVIIGSIQALQDPVKPKNIKPKFSTIEKEFVRLLGKDRDKLVELIKDTGIAAWEMELIATKIFKRIKRNKKNKIYGFSSSDEVLEHLVDTEDADLLLKEYDNWIELKKIVGNKRDRYFEIAIMIMDKYVSNKLYDAAMKGYASRVEKSQLLQKMVSKCELLLIDECDKASSKLYKPLIGKWFNGRYIYGFSGTPFDNARPVENLILRSRFGQILSKSTRAELTEMGAIQPVKYYMMKFGEEDRFNKMVYDIAEKEYVINNPVFHKTVKKICDSFPNDGTLILVDTSNVLLLGEQLEKIIPGSVFISGQTAIKKRDEALRAFESREIKVLIGSKIIKRGLDLNGGCENMIICGGGKRQDNFDQMIGRAVRKTKRGWSRVFDFYFACSYYLLNHSRKRLKFINEMGYETTVIYDGIQVPGQKFVKDRYRIKRK